MKYYQTYHKYSRSLRNLIDVRYSIKKGMRFTAIASNVGRNLHYSRALQEFTIDFSGETRFTDTSGKREKNPDFLLILYNYRFCYVFPENSVIRVFPKCR